MHNDNHVVDSHAHVFARDLPLAPGHRHAPQYDASREDYLRLLDDHNVAFGVLTAPSFLGTDNSFLLETLRWSGGRLRGTVIVDPAISRAALEEYALQGVVGIRFNWYKRDDVNLPDLASRECRRLFENCAGLGWHVEIYGEGPRLAKWLPTILQHGVRVVVDHFGSPDPLAGTNCPGFRCVLSSFSTGRLWVKLSAPYRVGFGLAAACVPMLLREGGAARLVWGSDWPWTQHERRRSFAECLDWLTAWVPFETARREILSDTPRALFSFA
jgi:predicted TIM-barrel fold metal-dependent hydrolase